MVVFFLMWLVVLLYLLAGLVANSLMQGLLVHVLLDLLMLGLLDGLGGLRGLCQCLYQVIILLYLGVNLLGAVVREVKGFVKGLLLVFSDLWEWK